MLGPGLVRAGHVQGPDGLAVGSSGVGHGALAATGQLAAAGRAVESGRADRLFEDPLAAALAGEEGFRLMEQWRFPGMPEENPTIAPRTRFYDDLLIKAIEDGLAQVVLVAAGMDAKAFRLPLGVDVMVFELDLPELLEQKQAIPTRSYSSLSDTSSQLAPTPNNLRPTRCLVL